MPARRPNPVDVTVGRNVRLHRLAAGLSQEALGDRIGVTFQQIQKYERGTNRIGASRLARIAEALDIPIAILFEGARSPTGGERTGKSLGELIAEPKAIRLARAFADIPDNDIRNCIVELLERIASSHHRA
jgi:transcriptional regulator with XRE-family HTH domain